MALDEILKKKDVSNDVKEEIRRSIADRKKAEEIFRETNEYLDNLFNYANAPIIVWDTQFRITRFNRAFETLTGRASHDVLGKSLEILFPEESLNNSMELINKTLSGERWESVEIDILNVNGNVRTVLWNSALVLAVDGKTTVATIAQGQDITERKHTEEALRETNEYLDNLFNYANAPIIVWDTQFRITRFNRAFEILTGRASHDVLGKSLEILFPEETLDSSMELIKKTHGGERWESVEIDILNVNGNVRTVLWNSALVLAADGKTAVATIAQGQDITERKQSEKELERSNKDLEQFAYVASHDLRSPLRAIESLALWIEEDVSDSLTPESRKHLVLLHHRIGRMEQLLSDLLDYSRIGRVDQILKEIELNNVLKQIIEILNIPNGFKVKILNPLPVFVTAVTPLSQVFQNLIGNAVKHHDRKTGEITIAVSEFADYFEFSVSDDGPGIPKEYYERVFGMFQTLKPRDEVEGSGIGLAIVKKIVEQYGGKITLSSEGGRGTEFRWTWPKTIPNNIKQ